MMRAPPAVVVLSSVPVRMASVAAPPAVGTTRARMAQRSPPGATARERNASVREAPAWNWRLGAGAARVGEPGRLEYSTSGGGDCASDGAVAASATTVRKAEA